ncbi:Myotubularin-related protein, partial [Ophiophagus hannah]
MKIRHWEINWKAEEKRKEEERRGEERRERRGEEREREGERERRTKPPLDGARQRLVEGPEKAERRGRSTPPFWVGALVGLFSSPLGQSRLQPGYFDRPTDRPTAGWLRDYEGKVSSQTSCLMTVIAVLLANAVFAPHGIIATTTTVAVAPCFLLARRSTARPTRSPSNMESSWFSGKAAAKAGALRCGGVGAPAGIPPTPALRLRGSQRRSGVAGEARVGRISPLPPPPTPFASDGHNSAARGALVTSGLCRRSFGGGEAGSCSVRERELRGAGDPRGLGPTVGEQAGDGVCVGERRCNKPEEGGEGRGKREGLEQLRCAPKCAEGRPSGGRAEEKRGKNYFPLGKIFRSGKQLGSRVFLSLSLSGPPGVCWTMKGEHEKFVETREGVDDGLDAESISDMRAGWGVGREVSRLPLFGEVLTGEGPKRGTTKLRKEGKKKQSGWARGGMYLLVVGMVGLEGHGERGRKGNTTCLVRRPPRMGRRSDRDGGVGEKKLCIEREGEKLKEARGEEGGAGKL